MIRKSKPEKGNKFYNTVSNGGLSKCIKGKPTQPGLDVLDNCVGAMNGWFAEGTGLNYIKYQFTMNAGLFVKYAKKWGLEVVDYPVIGGIMVFSKPGGAGHVYGVTDLDDTYIYTAESGYNSYAWKNKKRKISENYGMSSKYKFEGCIVNPYIGKNPKPSTKEVNVYYRVKTKENGWLPEVKNLNDYAGNGKPIIGLAMKVDKGSIKYRVHEVGGSWLGWITAYDINDIKKGYAGNNKPIDLVQVYYYTPNDIRPYKKAKYKVNNYGWQYDTETSNKQDGYAGVIGTKATKFQISIK